MTESELLSAIAEAYVAVSDTPVLVWGTNSVGVQRKSVQVFDASDEQSPPTGEVKAVDYYVLYAGEEDEEAYLPSGDTLPAFQKVNAVMVAKINPILIEE